MPHHSANQNMPSHLIVLHQEALQKAKNYQRAEYELLEVIEKVERLKVFRRRGFSSLYEYATRDLKLSEALAYHFISVARKVREVPALGKAIQENTISISKAKKMASVLNLENQEQWLEKAKKLTSRQLEKEVAKENPKAAVPEKASYVSGKRLQLQVGVDEKLMLQLRRVQDLESQRLQRPARIEEALQAMATLYLEKRDPQEKAKRSIARGIKQRTSMREKPKEKKTQAGEKEEGHRLHKGEDKCSKKLKTSQTQQFPGTVKIKVTPSGTEKPAQRNKVRIRDERFKREKRIRQALPAAIQHQVRLRDEGRCTYQDDDGKRCHQRRWLDFHHVVPVAAGGEDRLDNLQLLCRGHHQMIHT